MPDKSITPQMPTCYPDDPEIVVKMLHDFVVVAWDYSGKKIKLVAGKRYKIPKPIALWLQVNGYCYYTEAVNGGIP